MDSGLRYGLLGAVWLGARAPWAAVGGIRSAAHFRYLCGPSLFEYFAERLEGGWRSVHRRPKTRCGRCSDPLVVLHLYVKIRPLPTLLALRGLVEILPAARRPPQLDVFRVRPH